MEQKSSDLSGPTRNQNDARNVRHRTSYTLDQLVKLEESFQKSNYLTQDEHADLCRTLGLNKSQVMIWFQNRRVKEFKNKERPSGPLSNFHGNFYHHNNRKKPPQRTVAVPATRSAQAAHTAMCALCGYRADHSIAVLPESTDGVETVVGHQRSPLVRSAWAAQTPPPHHVPRRGPKLVSRPAVVQSPPLRWPRPQSVGPQSPTLAGPLTPPTIAGPHVPYLAGPHPPPYDDGPRPLFFYGPPFSVFPQPLCVTRPPPPPFGVTRPPPPLFGVTRPPPPPYGVAVNPPRPSPLQGPVQQQQQQQQYQIGPYPEMPTIWPPGLDASAAFGYPTPDKIRVIARQ